MVKNTKKTSTYMQTEKEPTMAVQEEMELDKDAEVLQKNKRKTLNQKKDAEMEPTLVKKKKRISKKTDGLTADKDLTISMQTDNESKLPRKEIPDKQETEAVFKAVLHDDEIREAEGALVALEVEVTVVQDDERAKAGVPLQTLRRSPHYDGSQAAREKKIEELGKMFDDLYHKKHLKHKRATQMLFDPTEQAYFVRYYDPNTGDYTPRKPAGSMSRLDRKLIRSAEECAGDWVRNTPGDAGKHDTQPPKHLVTKIPVLPQGNNPYRFTYSLASALLYCKFPLGGKILPAQVEIFHEHHFN